MLKTLTYREAMKIGYGFKRAIQSFRPYECEDNVWIDRSTERPELGHLIGADGKEPAIREGDTLVLLHYADIGDHWKERRRLLEWTARNGIMVQVRDQEPVLYDSEEKLAAYKAQNGGTKTQVDPGRPKRIKWTVEGAKEFAASWYGPGGRAGVRAAFERITGKTWNEKALNHCNNFFGPRNGSRKDKYLRFIGVDDG